MARNAFATFFLVLKAPPDKTVTLYLGSNPEGLTDSTLYEVLPDAKGPPDRLQKAAVPIFKRLEGGVGVYLVDAFVPESTPVRRVRYEFQFNVDDRWIIYPMEFRVQPATVPGLKLTSGMLGDLDATSADTSFGVLASYLCGKNEPQRDEALTIRSILRRNAVQDLALARKVEMREGREKVIQGILNPLGAATPAAWCAAHSHPDPETYLRVRDFLYRIAVN